MMTEFLDVIPRASIHFVGMSFISLFTTLNPIGATAFFLSHPETLESEIYRKKIAKRGAMAAFFNFADFRIVWAACVSYHGRDHFIFPNCGWNLCIYSGV
jgi:hypothetical protein